MTKTRAEELALLNRRIAESGLSIRAFAEEVLIREKRTVERWRAGGAIPARVVRWLEDPQLAPWPKD